jgi:hypothetical protein
VRWVCSCMLMLCLAAQQADAAIELQRDWIRLELDGIEVITNTDAGRAVEIARQVAPLRRSLGMWTIVEPVTERPLRLYVFHDFESYRPYVPRNKKNEKGAVAGYTAYSDTHVMMALMAHYTVYRRYEILYGYYSPLEILSHELVHAWLADRAPRTPLWLHEGLADFYSSYRVEDDYVYVGEPLDRHRLLLEEQGRYLPMGRLLLLDHDSEDYHGGSITQLTYAQCWANVHYLMTQKERRRGLVQFMRDIHEGMPEIAAMNRDLLPNMTEQGEPLREYVTQDQMPYFRLKRKGTDDATTATRSELERKEALLYLGELATGVGPDAWDFARQHFRDCLEEDPGMVEARMGLARIEIYDEGWQPAQIQLREVLAADPGNRRARGLMGIALVGEYEGVTGAAAWNYGTELPDAVVEAREHLSAALEQEHPDPSASYTFARTFAGSRDPGRGLAALEDAIAAAPWHTEFYELLVRLHTSTGNLDQARSVFDDELSHRMAPVERYETEMELVKAEARRAEDMWHAGRGHEASLALLRILEATDFAPTRTYLKHALTRIELDVPGQRYVEILELAHAGQYEEAVARLDGLLVDADDPDLKLMAADLRERMVMMAEATS